jgi:histidyl-tRNA synthetase
MLLRQSIFRKITDVFELHGGVTIDTPVFELKEILSGKYGEDSKLIYDLQDQGGELCSLRYDLTVNLVPPGALTRDEELTWGLSARVSFATGSLRPLPRHQRLPIPQHQALPHRQGLPPGPARHVQGAHARVLPMRECRADCFGAELLLLPSRVLTLTQLVKDFDIAGTYDPMLPDAEILTIACEVLDSLGIGEFTIKVRSPTSVLVPLHSLTLST